MQVLKDLKSSVFVLALAPFSLVRVHVGFRAAARAVFFPRRLFRSFRTLMSIEKRVGFVFKVLQDLNNERRA